MILEPLEKRLAPAGVVAIVLSGGALKITGDTLDNTISITEIAPDTFRITGDSTTLNFGGGSGGEFEVSGVTKGLTLDLKDGNDNVALTDVSVNGAVSVALGSGNNGLTLTGVAVTGDLTMTGLKGNDTIEADATALSVTGKTTINLSDGANSVSLDDMTAMSFGKGLFYTGGTGVDDLLFDGGSFVSGAAVDLKVGAGGGTANITGALVNIQGSLGFTALDHSTAESSFLIDTDLLSVGGSVTIKQGNGINSVEVSGDETVVLGSVSITQGNDTSGDDDEGSVAMLSGDSIKIGGSVSITSGTGYNGSFIQAEDQLLIGGKVTVSHGTGGTMTEISADSVQIGDSITITNKNGLHQNLVAGGSVHVTNAITITNGNTESETETTDNFINGLESFDAGSIKITNGVGNFSNLVSMLPQGEEPDEFYATGSISGGITIKNGNSVPATVSEPAGSGAVISGSPEPVQEGTSNLIAGSFNITGGIAITNGNGEFTNIIGSEVTDSSFYVGAGIAITNGTAVNSGHFNVLTGEVFNVKQGITIKNGNSTFGGSNIFDVGDLTAAAVSITNGNSTEEGMLNGLGIGVATLGSLTIKNGTTENTLNTVLGDELIISGSLSITNGNVRDGVVNVINGGFYSGASITIKNGNADGIFNDIGFEGLTLTGALSITNGNLVENGDGETEAVIQLAPEENLITNTVEGEFITLGSLTMKNGTGWAVNMLGADYVTILGAVNYTSAGHEGSDPIGNILEGEEVRVGGPITFATAKGDTINRIGGDIAEFGSSITLNHGAGDDLTMIGADDSFVINGSITAKLGAGDTDTSIGADSSAFSITGSISVTSLDGDDLLNVTTDGRITGGITANFGTGLTNTVNIGDSTDNTNPSLYVGGAISVVAKPGGTLNVSLRDGSYGAFTLTGSDGEDIVTIDRAIMRGAVKLDLKGAGDTVSINDSTFLSSLTVLTGGGTDQVAIEDDATAAGGSRFMGAVSINLGDGDDVLRLNSAGAPSFIGFHSSVAFDGGTGSNDLFGNTGVNFYGPAALVNNFAI